MEITQGCEEDLDLVSVSEEGDPIHDCAAEEMRLALAVDLVSRSWHLVDVPVGGTDNRLVERSQDGSRRQGWEGREAGASCSVVSSLEAGDESQGIKFEAMA